MCKHDWICETYPVNFLANVKCKICGQETKMVAVFPMGRGEATATATNDSSPETRRWAKRVINQILEGNGKAYFEGTRQIHVDKLQGIFERH